MSDFPRDNRSAPPASLAATCRAIDVPPMAESMAPPVNDGTHDVTLALPLGPRGWACVIISTLLGVVLIPKGFERNEAFEPQIAWRIPSRLAEDLDLVARRVKIAETRQETVWLGDSVIWGEYARPGETLPALIEQQFPSQRFANFGLEGLHPLALHGLVQLFPELTERKVIVYFNPIWSTSPRRDLRVAGVGTINHMPLLPQFGKQIPAYEASGEQRIATWLGREIPLWRWTSHMRLVHFDGRDPVQWMTEHPNRWPSLMMSRDGLSPEDVPSSRVRRRNASPLETTYEWVKPDDSLQFQSFVDTLELLAREPDRCFCVVGRLDPSGRTAKCLALERELHDQLLIVLRRLEIPFFESSLESLEMADASHPTPQGYKTLARQLSEDPTFLQWLKEGA